jgi:hypothetical protein
VTPDPKAEREKALEKWTSTHGLDLPGHGPSTIAGCRRCDDFRAGYEIAQSASAERIAELERALAAAQANTSRLWSNWKYLEKRVLDGISRVEIRRLLRLDISDPSLASALRATPEAKTDSPTNTKED